MLVIRGFGQKKITVNSGTPAATGGRQHNAATVPMMPPDLLRLVTCQDLMLRKTQCSDTTECHPLTYVILYHVLKLLLFS